jgi:hypothetical protein
MSGSTRAKHDRGPVNNRAIHVKRKPTQYESRVETGRNPLKSRATEVRGPAARDEWGSARRWVHYQQGKEPQRR